MPITQEQCENLKKHEGFRSKVYKCPAGKDTLGYGYNLESNMLLLSKRELDILYVYGITEHQAERLLKQCCNVIEKELTRKLDFYEKLDSVTQYVLLNMAYCLGVEGLLKFKKTLSLVEQGRLNQASVEMLDSTWAKQVKGRATELSKILKTGKLR